MLAVLVMLRMPPPVLVKPPVVAVLLSTPLNVAALAVPVALTVTVRAAATKFDRVAEIDRVGGAGFVQDERRGIETCGAPGQRRRRGNAAKTRQLDWLIAT